MTSFFNQYNSLEAGKLFDRLQDVIGLVRYCTQPQVHDKAMLQYNKEQTLAYFKNCPWNHLFDCVEYVLTLDTDRVDALAENTTVFSGCMAVNIGWSAARLFL